MKCEYAIIPEYRVIIEKLEGDVSIEESIAMSTKLFADPMYDTSYTILVDIRNYTSVIDKTVLISNGEVFAQFARNNCKHGNTNVGMLISEPLHSVIVELFRNNVLDLPLQISFFTTVEGALKYLHLLKYSKQIIATLSEM
ncbi:MAG TPA: hypothetical protein P5243_03115 [Bacteroidales bacterium]|nr:hypothetical protein [Bacteroidales bacterium]HRS18471.1 hypothetical protein [Bacteroidales bacterium]